MARRLIPKFLVIPENVGRGIFVSGLFHVALLGSVIAAAPQLFGDTLDTAEVPITIQIFEDVYEVAQPVEVAAVEPEKPAVPIRPAEPAIIQKPDKAPEVAVPNVREGAIIQAGERERPADSGPVPTADGTHDVSVVYERGPALTRREELGGREPNDRAAAGQPPLPTDLVELQREIKKLEVLRGQAEVEEKLAAAARDKQAQADAAARLAALQQRLKRLEIERRIAETEPPKDPATPKPTTVAARDPKPETPKADDRPDTPRPDLSAQEILDRSQRREAERSEADRAAIARARKALQRMREAAKQGIPSAQMNLAKALDRGKGVKKDPERAKKIYERLAKRNYQPAQLELARKLLTGDGVKKDQTRAYVLLKTAADEDNIVAKRALKSLRNDLNDDQRRKADAEANKLRRHIQKQRADNKLTSVQQKKLDTDLRVAIDQGNVQRIESLLRSGADPNAIDASGKDAIIAASWRGREMVVQFLIEGGVDIEAIDLEGRTPLIWASINGYRAIVEVLLEHGADPDGLDDESRTALMRAAWNGRLEVVQTLLNHGASPAITDTEGKTALDRAREEEWTQVVQLLERQ